MDMEMDFSDDKIQSFLSTKLEEIRLNNEALKTVLNQHKNALATASSDVHLNEISFKVVEGESWKRIFNNKYAIGYVISTSGMKDFKDIRLFLMWDSEETLSYKVETFGIHLQQGECKNSKSCGWVTDTIKQSNSFREKAILVIVFEVPQYLNKLEYEISGNFVCTVESKDFNISLPKVKVLATDLTTNTNWITFGHSQNFLINIFTMMACSAQSDLVLILPEEWSASLISTFEIHCGFTYIDLTISCKTYFVASNVSKLFDNVLIVVHPTAENKNRLILKVFAASNAQIYALCHHLNTCLPNNILFPLNYYEYHLCKNDTNEKQLLDEFARSMQVELGTRCTFAELCSNNTSRQQINQFQSKLSTIESNTDKLFLKVSNMKY